MPWSSSTRPGSTRASRALRARVLAAWPTCYLQYPGCTQATTQDDHIVPLSQGGTDEWANHAGACERCHKRKTQAEARAARTTTKRTTPPHPGLIPPK